MTDPDELSDEDVDHLKDVSRDIVNVLAKLGISKAMIVVEMVSASLIASAFQARGHEDAIALHTKAITELVRVYANELEKPEWPH